MPAVSSEGLIISCTINAMEGRDVSTDDVKGAFLQTNYDKEDINTNMEGMMVTKLEEIYP